MVQTRIPAEDRVATVAPVQEVSAEQSVALEVGHRRHLSPFWRHFLEMLAAMVVGMIATGAVFLSIVGLKTWDQVTIQYPTQALVAMAGGMSIPMVGWMLYRGMGRRNAYEMAAMMVLPVLPVLPLLCLVWFGVTKSAQCGAYCALTIVAMLLLMGYRRSQYSMPM
jgi:cytochrome bd-type quinol oxidase subunit 2